MSTTELVLHFRPDLKASAEWIPFEKEGYVWRFFEKVEEDTFILTKEEVKIIRVPKAYHIKDPFSIYERDFTNFIEFNKSYKVITFFDNKTFNFLGSEIKYIVFSEKNTNWYKFVFPFAYEEGKKRDFIIKFNDFSFSKDLKGGTSIVFNKSLDFFEANEEPSEIRRIKFDKITPEKANKIIEDKVFYIDIENNFTSHDYGSDRKTVFIKGDFRVRKILPENLTEPKK